MCIKYSAIKRVNVYQIECNYWLMYMKFNAIKRLIYVKFYVINGLKYINAPVYQASQSSTASFRKFRCPLRKNRKAKLLTHVSMKQSTSKTEIYLNPPSVIIHTNQLLTYLIAL